MQKSQRHLSPAEAGRQFVAATAALIIGLTLFLLGPVGAAAQSQQYDEIGGQWITPESQTQSVDTPAQVTDYDYASQSLRVELWFDRPSDSVYQRNDQQQVYVQTNEDAYAVVYRIDTTGRVEILWPRSRLDDGFVFGHHEYRLPATGAARLRTSTEEGVGYVEAVVSRYPFDLRELPLDFFHEPQDPALDFYVAGDPFLAMNEVNFVVTGLEDPADFVVTNYASYYVHRVVDHPRYLCNQCHVEEDLAHHPYRDNCTVEIHYDYGWSNEWYVAYGYYPVYYYPTFYYVDPWTARPWVNYWYRPYYLWPASHWYTWGYGCYPWHDSPYYNGDVWTHYRNGNRRYTPLDKTMMGRERAGDVRTRTRNDLVRASGPDDREIQAMRDRRSTAIDRNGRRDGDSRVADRGTYVDRGAIERKRQGFERGDRVATRNGGVRIQDRRTVSDGYRHGGGGDPVRGQEVRRRTDSARGTSMPSRGGKYDVPTRNGASDPRVRSGDRPNGSMDRRVGDRNAGGGDRSRRAIKPVEPRNRGTRVWSGRRTSPSGDRAGNPTRVRPQSQRGDGGSRGTVDRSGTRTGGNRSKPQTQQRTGSSGSSNRKSGADRGSPSRVAPRGNSGRSAPARPSTPPPSRGAGGGRSRSGGGRTR